MNRQRFSARISRPILAALLLSGSGMIPVAAAWAQQSSDQIEDIVVTATKREQNLSAIGISVSVLRGDDLIKLGVLSSDSLATAIPNFENATVYGPGSNTNFAIRGVGQNDFNDATESPIATYVDDVYLVPTGAGSFPLYDIERVEVLRGPQGTLFGRNSTGGLIHFISVRPKHEFEASLSGKYGSYDTREITGMLNVPVTETLALRLSGQYHKNDPWLRHITGNQPGGGGLTTQSVRGQVRWDASDTVTNNLLVSYNKAGGFTTGLIHEAVGFNAATGDQYLLGPDEDFYGTGPQRDAFGQANTKNGTDRGSLSKLLVSRSILVTNKLDIEIGKLNFTSVTGFNDLLRSQVEDCDVVQIRICDSRKRNKNQQYSQELRLFGDFEATRFTLGAYYLRHRITLDELTPLFLSFPEMTFALRDQARQVAKSYALFGNVEYDVAPNLTAIVGLRGSKDKKHFQETLGYVLPADPTNPFPNFETAFPKNVPIGDSIARNDFTDETAPGLTRINKNTWAAKLELDYKPNDDTLVYGSASRGVKSPGFNNGQIDIATPKDAWRFKAETLYAYEVGVKSSFMDRRASLNFSAFYYDYKNFQTLSFQGFGSFISNSKARVFGIESDFTIKPVAGLTLKLNGGYVNSELKDIANSGSFVADRDMPLAPRWTIGGMARYESSVGTEDHVLGVQIDGKARGSFYNNPGNDSAAKIDGVTLVNGRIDLTDRDNRYTVALTANNIFDVRKVSSVFLLRSVGGYRYGHYNPPRWLALELTYRLR